MNDRQKQILAQSCVLSLPKGADKDRDVAFLLDMGFLVETSNGMFRASKAMKNEIMAILGKNLKRLGEK